MNNFWKNKKVLVTGGTGFIGRHLTEELFTSGAQVTIPTSRPSAGNRPCNFLISRANLIQADLTQNQDAKNAIQGQQIVIHLAANIGGVEYNMSHPASIFQTNMRMFMNIIEASHEEGIDRVLVVSTACIYPRLCTIPTPESEGFLGVPEPVHAGHGWAKRMEEFLASAYHEEFGMKVGIARLFNVYGPGDHFGLASAGVIPSLIQKVFEAETELTVWGDGSQSRSFLYVKDCVRGLMSVCENYSMNDALNLGADEETQMGDLARTIIKLCQKNLTLHFDTSKPSGQPRRHCDTKKAFEKIGFQTQYSLEAGLTETIQWYKENLL